MRKIAFIVLSILLFLSACKDRSREIDVSVVFKGDGEFEICFDEGNKEFKVEPLYFHLYATTKNGFKRERETIISKPCNVYNFIQLKLGAYSRGDLEEMKTQFIPGNIESVKVEIFYSGEYNNPFITKEFKNL